MWICDQFLALNVKVRWRIAREKGLCYRCLSSDHIGVDGPQAREVLMIAKNTHSRHLHLGETIEQKSTEPEQDRKDKECSRTAMG